MALFDEIALEEFPLLKEEPLNIIFEHMEELEFEQEVKRTSKALEHLGTELLALENYTKDKDVIDGNVNELFIQEVNNKHMFIGLEQINVTPSSFALEEQSIISKAWKKIKEFFKTLVSKVMEFLGLKEKSNETKKETLKESKNNIKKNKETVDENLKTTKGTKVNSDNFKDVKEDIKQQSNEESKTTSYEKQTEKKYEKERSVQRTNLSWLNFFAYTASDFNEFHNVLIGLNSLIGTTGMVNGIGEDLWKLVRATKEIDDTKETIYNNFVKAMPNGLIEQQQGLVKQLGKLGKDIESYNPKYSTYGVRGITVKGITFSNFNIEGGKLKGLSSDLDAFHYIKNDGIKFPENSDVLIKCLDEVSKLRINIDRKITEDKDILNILEKVANSTDWESVKDTDLKHNSYNHFLQMLVSFTPNWQLHEMYYWNNLIDTLQYGLKEIEKAVVVTNGKTI